jgi:hypothetical protein
LISLPAEIGSEGIGEVLVVLDDQKAQIQAHDDGVWGTG